MSMIGRHKQLHRQAEEARDRFEKRLGRMRGEIDSVSTRSRAKLRDRAPKLLPWVFTLGFIIGLWKPLTLRGLFRGTMRAGRTGHVVSAGVSALMNSSIGRQAMARAEAMVTETFASHAETASKKHAEQAEQEAAAAEDAARRSESTESEFSTNAAYTGTAATEPDAASQRVPGVAPGSDVAPEDIGNVPETGTRAHPEGPYPQGEPGSERPPSSRTQTDDGVPPQVPPRQLH